MIIDVAAINIYLGAHELNCFVDVTAEVRLIEIAEIQLGEIARLQLGEIAEVK